MHVPAWFREQLRAEHGDHYRIRWSNAQQAFLLEEKVARGISTPPRRLALKLRKLEKKVPGITEEKLEQARSGHLLFLEIRPSPKAPCPSCGASMSLAPHAIEWATCPVCAKSSAICHVELGDRLLQHLRYIDIHRGGDERVLADMDRANAQLEEGAMRDAKNTLTSAVIDDFNRLHQIQSVGYTGKVHPGTDVAGVTS